LTDCRKLSLSNITSLIQPVDQGVSIINSIINLAAKTAV